MNAQAAAGKHSQPETIHPISCPKQIRQEMVRSIETSHGMPYRIPRPGRFGHGLAAATPGFEPFDGTFEEIRNHLPSVLISRNQRF